MAEIAKMEITNGYCTRMAGISIYGTPGSATAAFADLLYMPNIRVAEIYDSVWDRFQVVLDPSALSKSRWAEFCKKRRVKDGAAITEMLKQLSDEPPRR